MTHSSAPRIRKGQSSIFVSQEFAKPDVEVLRRMQGYVEDDVDAQSTKRLVQYSSTQFLSIISVERRSLTDRKGTNDGA